METGPRLDRSMFQSKRVHGLHMRLIRATLGRVTISLGLSPGGIREGRGALRKGAYASPVLRPWFRREAMSWNHEGSPHECLKRPGLLLADNRMYGDAS